MLKRRKPEQSLEDSAAEVIGQTAGLCGTEAALTPDHWGRVASLSYPQSGEVVVIIEVDPARGTDVETQRAILEQNLLKRHCFKKASVILTAHNPEKATDPGFQNKRTPDPHGMEKNPKLTLPIKKIIAVASGKGGVGKSTVAAGLAAELAKKNQKTGLLDADIYGPSQPKMMGLEGQKPVQENGKISPLEAYGIKVMSIGFMVDAAKALVWRGPMVQTAIYQLLRDVDWRAKDENGNPCDLDILIVDMPPGTGDAQLTMAQKVPLSGAVIVSTPQDIALLDARKGVEMFQTVGVPILGIIENMSTHVCSNCGHEEHIFGHGGAKEEAEKLGAPFLGSVPLDIAIRQNGDKGKPADDRFFDEITDNLIKALSSI